MSAETTEQKLPAASSSGSWTSRAEPVSATSTFALFVSKKIEGIVQELPAENASIAARGVSRFASRKYPRLPPIKLVSIKMKLSSPADQTAPRRSPPGEFVSAQSTA